MTPSKSAVPFWLAVDPTVSTNRETSRRELELPLGDVCSDSGSVAFEEAVEKA